MDGCKDKEREGGTGNCSGGTFLLICFTLLWPFQRLYSALSCSLSTQEWCLNGDPLPTPQGQGDYPMVTHMAQM